jgi:hypothetical protein
VFTYVTSSVEVGSSPAAAATRSSAFQASPDRADRADLENVPTWYCQATHFLFKQHPRPRPFTDAHGGTLWSIDGDPT